jgi:hypothetical protein
MDSQTNFIPRLTRRLTALRWLVPAAVLIAGAGLLFRVQTPRLEIGEGDKVGSGRSLAGQLAVEAQPAASPLNAGFDRARLWSEYDDWEPAIAVAPSGAAVSTASSVGVDGTSLSDHDPENCLPFVYISLELSRPLIYTPDC